MPARSVAVELAGAVYFATASPVWGGGRAFYDPLARGRVLARAHLVTVEQFSDIAAQEMYRAPGADVDLTEVLAHGRAALGDGRYETLVRVGSVDGLPLLTFTAPWRLGEVAPHPPSTSYVRCLATGLLATRAWDAETVAAYVAGCSGAAGRWSVDAVRDLLEANRFEEPLPGA
jgi:hypothetical protein